MGVISQVGGSRKEEEIQVSAPRQYLFTGSRKSNDDMVEFFAYLLGTGFRYVQEKGSTRVGIQSPPPEVYRPFVTTLGNHPRRPFALHLQGSTSRRSSSARIC